MSLSVREKGNKITYILFTLPSGCVKHWHLWRTRGLLSSPPAMHCPSANILNALLLLLFPTVFFYTSFLGCGNSHSSSLRYWIRKIKPYNTASPAWYIYTIYIYTPIHFPKISVGHLSYRKKKVAPSLLVTLHPFFPVWCRKPRALLPNAPPHHCRLAVFVRFGRRQHLIRILLWAPLRGHCHSFHSPASSQTPSQQGKYRRNCIPFGFL